MTIELTKLPKLDQARIDEVSTMYQTNRNMNEGLLDPEDFLSIDSVIYTIDASGKRNFARHDDRVNKDYEGQSNEKIVYLASVSKLGIILEFAKLAQEKGLTHIKVPIQAITEIIMRDQAHRLFDREDIYGEFIQTLNLDESEKAILLDNKSEEHANIKNKCITLLEETYKDSTFDLSINEVEVLTLGLSCNIPLVPAKDFLLKNFDDIEELQKRFDEVVPNGDYRMTISTLDNYHWLQKDTNTGKISAFLELLHHLAERYMHDELSPEEAEVFETMIDNPESFKFDFTHSELGQELIKQGWKIVEKTGYYGSVNWVEKLAKEGYPIHMSMSTIVTLIPPEDKGNSPISFCYNENTEISFPVATISEGDLKFPDVDSKKYSEDYVLGVKAQVMPGFRRKCIAIGKQLLNVK